MANWVVYKEEKRVYVKGLASWSSSDTLLIHWYPEGDCDHPFDTQTMHGALYALYQRNDSVKEGDTFTTPYGNFKCVSFLVQPYGERVLEVNLLDSEETKS